MRSSLVLLSLLAACGGDDSPGSTPDVDAADGSSVSDGGTDVGGPDTDAGTEEVTPDVEIPDADGSSAPDTDVVEDPCPGSILCFDERTGNPSAAVCINAGLPPGTTCVSSSEEVACCVPPFACETDDDCEAARLDEGFCLDTRFPCACQDDGSCTTRICSADSECADGEVCTGGRCEDAPVFTGRAVRALSRRDYVQPGDTLSLMAVAHDVADARRTDPAASITWTLVDGSGGTVTPEGVFTAGETAGTATLEAQVTGTDDPADTVTIVNLGNGEPGSFRVLVVDEATRLPVADAAVALVRSSDEALATVPSDENGLVVDDSGDVLQVHVFAEGYAYVSVIAPEGETLVIALPPTQAARIDEVRDGFVCPVENEGVTFDDTEVCGDVGQPACLCYQLQNVDVVKGVPDFEAVAGPGELDVAISGFSLGNALLDLNFDLIVGPEITRVPPEDSPIPLDDQIGIPSGVSMYYNNSPFVDSFIGTAPAGERVIWSIGGTVVLSDVLVEILPSLGGDLAFGPIIAALLPLFDDFYSGISAPVELSTAGTFPVRDPGVVLDVPTQRRLVAATPQLPELGDGWSDTAIILGGALMPGEGFVPMGITGGTDVLQTATPDGRVDADQNTPEVDPLGISMGTIHGALDTPFTRYMFATVALQLGDSSAGDATSGILTLLEDGAPLPTEVPYSDEDFPAFMTGASYSGADSELRLVTVGSRDEAVDMFRVIFQGQSGRNWVVYAPGDTLSFEMPDVSGLEGVEDRTARGEANVIALEFRAESGVDFASVLDANGTNLMDLFLFIERFSIIGL
jgi:hypothetical protein